MEDSEKYLSKIGDNIEINNDLDKIKSVKFTSGIENELKNLKIKFTL